MDAIEAFSGCGEQDRKGANKLKEGDGTNRCELGGMGMMGE